MDIKINKLSKENILTEDFLDLNTYNEISFSNDGIAIIYGPNGAGKSTIAKILNRDNNSEYNLFLNETEYTHESEINPFHVINDQNGRNIIKGETEDFVLGDNVLKEYELKKKIDIDFNNLFQHILIPGLKETFQITSKSNSILSYIENQDIYDFVCDLANNRSKGKDIDRSNFIDITSSLGETHIEEDEFDEKFIFFVSDFSSKRCILKKIIEFGSEDISGNEVIHKIEQNDDAVIILEKYNNINDCIVCDSEIEPAQLLSEKKITRENNYNSLDEKTKKIFNSILKVVGEGDPFDIKIKLLEAINKDDYQIIESLKVDIQKYIEIFNDSIMNFFANCLNTSQLLNNHNEYEQLKKEKLEFSDDDALFIEKFINDCLSQKVELKRDDDKNLVLLLGNKEFLNKRRDELYLSTGEQNFISLAFELLKAKRVENSIVILDDPISSFDSIYKNKITYAILRFLKDKKQIILTHNLDLIRLLEHQKQNSYNLYILNNTQDEENGFIEISENEHKFLLYLHELLNFLRKDVLQVIKNEKYYLISMIPFMRGLSQILNKMDIKEKLTDLMHGYNEITHDLSEIYNELFEVSIISSPLELSAKDILEIHITDEEIIDSVYYPLLNKTLIHTFTYLYLRLKVEKKLVDKFSIMTNKYQMLSSIINKAFNGNDPEVQNSRIFLLSRKTLLNEFNHFEVDMNIFQPAIDITNSSLKKEKEDILSFLEFL